MQFLLENIARQSRNQELWDADQSDKSGSNSQKPFNPQILPLTLFRVRDLVEYKRASYIPR